MKNSIFKNNNNVKKWAKLILNDIVLSIAIYFFLISTNLNTGGMDGLAMLMDKFVPKHFFTKIFSNFSVFIVIFQLLFLFIGWKYFGKEFFTKTSFLVMILMISAPIFDLLTGNNPKIFFDLLHIKNMYIQLVITSIMSGILIGFTVANIRNHGYNTGGMDIVHKILKDKFNINFIIILFMTDGVLISVDSLLKSMEDKEVFGITVLVEICVRLLLSYLTITIIGYIMEKKNKLSFNFSDKIKLK
jgi:uncharacterized membrane-anchored protein YitT (DUF2179 family)